MKRNFAIDQNKILQEHNLTIDPDIRDGLCAGMVIEWLRREISGQRQSGIRYRHAEDFTSRQRSFDLHYEVKKELPLALKSDSFTSTLICNSKAQDLSFHLRAVSAGFFCLGLFPDAEHLNGHMIGLAIEDGRYRIFDPNHGEFETTNKHVPNMALLKCQKFISTHYLSVSSARMEIYELKRKFTTSPF
ncbi:hypothetical protein [Rahnella woolbedingensis]|uniref:Peptidase C58 YopT-type domain-containing protein n=1 Tax=Rahnella woolbedingensis TaxID=1510574 RepID=A0A419N4R1_9GAMM|nr:hypothetical protein [Rahnella woolbedingensis]RJT40152.1 hypothetical protein D6C13_19500 [Rahnella woolbedingensis]